MVIFRENTEDIYAGIEFAAGTPRPTRRSSNCPRRQLPEDFDKIRFKQRPEVGWILEFLA